IDEFVDDPPEFGLFDLVDGAVELQRLPCGQIPPKRILLAKDEAELALKVCFSFPRNIIQNACCPRIRNQEIGKHLQDGGFSGAVRSQEPDEFSFLDFEG